MSMIHGILRRDGRPADAAAIQPMQAAARTACPDGEASWHDGQAALAFGLLRTLPQGRTAPGPVRDTASGRVIVADGRIDNRAELRARLAWDKGREASDAELILDAYGKWGEACAEYLAGDFAFAIWDPARRRLYCARDIFGVSPFYYACPKGSFIFSSHLSSLLALAEIPRELDDHAIADQLAGLTRQADHVLYKGVFPLPPAHCLTVGEDGVALRRYWQPPAVASIQLASDEDYVEAYGALLEEAVACRLAAAGPVSGLLSGGLDSGAIAVVAAGQLAAQGSHYPTYSFVLAPGQEVFDRDERQLIELMHRLPAIDGHFITTRDFPGHAADLYTGLGDHAFLGNGPHVAALLGQLRAANSRVLLDGYGGDQCPTCGSGIPLREFLDGFHFVRLAEHLAAASRASGKSMPRLLFRMLRVHFQMAGAVDIDDLVSERSVLASSFLQQTRVLERARCSPLFQPMEYRSLRDLMVHRLQQGKGLQFHSLFSAHHVERRYPFLDKRLVEFCLAVPSRQHNHGLNRRLIRRAMAGRMPERIWLRNDKSVSNAPGTLMFLAENRDYYIAAIDAARDNAPIAARIDLAKLRRRFADILPLAVAGANSAGFLPGPTLRGFNMIRFLQAYAASMRD